MINKLYLLDDIVFKVVDYFSLFFFVGILKGSLLYLGCVSVLNLVLFFKLLDGIVFVFLGFFVMIVDFIVLVFFFIV